MAGAFGIAGCACGIGIFLASCAGQAAALRFSPFPLALGGLGLLFTIAAGTIARDRIHETTHVLASIFTAVCAVIGGLVELAAWMGWTTFR
jgi:hypothetical protein